MKFSPRFVFLFALFLVWKAFAVPPSGYYEVWGDEFNGSSLDPTKWWVWNQQDRSGYSTPSAVTVTNGYMTIQVYSTNGQNYSGIVSSDGRFRARYGYMEASVEFNGSPGMFSDFWINSADNGAFIGDPAAEGAEVDVCEHRVTDANNKDNISGNVTIDLHWNGYGSSETSFNSPFYGSGLGTGFHTYGLLWTTNNYQASIDGVLTLTTNGGLSRRTEIVLFSCEVDSNSFCGIVPTGGYGNANVSTTSTVVDYFRFYAPTTTVYWLGASSANWTDSGNWLSNMVPTAASDVVFSFLTVGNPSVNLSPGTTVNSLSIQEPNAITLSGGSLTVGGGGIDLLSAVNNTQMNSPLALGANQSWSIAAGITLNIGSVVTGNADVTQDQFGAVAIYGTNNSTGSTFVNNGSLLDYGVINNSTVVGGGSVGGTGLFAGPVTVNAGLLTGTETFTAPVVINAGGTLEPGSPVGAMVISNALTLGPGSITLINLNDAPGDTAQINGLSSITFGGTLVVSNQGAALAPGNSFNIFHAQTYSGAFSRITPSTPGPGLVWDTADLASSGVLRVISSSPGSITAQALPGTQQLMLSWPASNIGWNLQTQTNPPGVGLTTNWVTVPGSAATNVLLTSVNTNVGSVFFRLAAPGFNTAVFAPGDLLVLQLGNGSVPTSGAPGTLVDFSPFGGAALNQIPLPTSGSNAFIFGASSYDGSLSSSADGQFVVIAGYNVPLGYISSAIDSSSTTGSLPVPRAVGTINASGAFALAATTTAFFSGSTVRAATSDGQGNFWAGGGNSGIVYLGNNAPATTVFSGSSATRNIQIVNGNLIFAETGDGIGLMSFSGHPTNAATASMLINCSGVGLSPKGYAFNPAMNIAYIADNDTNVNGGGVQRFNWNGSSWVHAYTLQNTATSSKEVLDLAVDFSGSNPVIYAVTDESANNHVIKGTDTGSGSTFSTLETAPSGDVFRGVVLAPAGW